jgi:cyclophilin family peptidyl-prolyl cis-trans isomerase
MSRILTALVLFALLAGCGGKAEAPAAETPTRPDTPAVESPAPAVPGTALTDTLTAAGLPANLFLTIKVKDHGTLKVKFHTEDAPKNVTNVANLAIKGFYNGLTFHRIVPGFVVQGGDPQGDGTGGPGYTVEAEIKRKHLKGSLAMARTGDQVNPERRSSGSQFYLCLQPLAQLDGAYTVIGDLVEGLDVLERIGAVATGPMDRPTVPVVMESVHVTTE